MPKVELTKPLVILLYGFPGAGKTAFARSLADLIQVAHVHSDRIRHELFEAPKYDKPENQIVSHLTEYMLEEFLGAGVSIIYDGESIRSSQRRAIREVARKAHADTLTIWFQLDPDTAYSRLSRRDRRKYEDKYARPTDRPTFDTLANAMQPPDKTEPYVVVSGKHSFAMQRSTVMRKLLELKLVQPDSLSASVVKPGLINLVPTAGRVDLSRRNITIR